jgi:hypothetical protein
MSVQLNEKAAPVLLSTTTVDMKTAQSNLLYTVPTGKVLRITALLVRDPTASLASGTSYSVTNWRQAFSLTGLTTANTGYYYILGADLTVYVESAASVAIYLVVTTGSSLAANATIDLFGILSNA